MFGNWQVHVAFEVWGILFCLMAGRIPFCLFFLSPRKPLCWVFAGAYVRTGERAQGA